MLLSEREKIDNGFCLRTGHINLVTGETDLYRAVTNRSEGQACGPEGKLFEAK
jgi:hypothetical protein